jgi:hypothetical protein
MGSSACAIRTHTERTPKRLSVIVRIVRWLDDGLPKSKHSRLAPAALYATGNHCWDWDLLECFGNLDVSSETNFKLTHYQQTPANRFGRYSEIIISDVLPTVNGWYPQNGTVRG